MIDRDTALGHHLFKITQTERVGDVPPHAQQHHIERIVEALQDPGDARSKRLSRCLRFLHRAAKAYLSASNTTSDALARQNLVDLLSRNTTWTLVREATLGVQFAGVLFYDGQAFMVPKQRGANAVAALDGATVCVEKGTSSEIHLGDYFAARHLSVKPLVVDSASEVANAVFAGSCSAYTCDGSALAAARLRAPGGAQAYTILPEQISKEPLGPVVRDDDAHWLTLVRWVFFSLIAAEEANVTRENVGERMRDPVVARAFDAGDDVSKAIGVEPGWAVRAVQSVGNYGQMFDRNLGPGSSLNLERGLNRLWTQGGLMYA